MIRPIRPGKLRGLSDEQIAKELSKLMECPVECFDLSLRIRCFDSYPEDDDNTQLVRHTRKLRNVGNTFFGYDIDGPYVGLTFNTRAREIITNPLPLTPKQENTL